MMKRTCLFMALASIGSIATAQSSHYVHGYSRSDGTYVQPHMQTNPNSTPMDNWTTRGNVNPYTGQAGTRDPYGSSSGYGSTYGGSSTGRRSGSGY